jgi:predicted kinase
VLALWSLGRARRLSRRFPLPLHEPYFQQLLRQLRSGAARVRLCPHAQAPSAQATLALRDISARGWGDRVQIDVDAAVGFGDEERAAAPAATAADVDAAIVLFDMGATPEAEQQGRLVRRLADALPAGVPLLLLVDEAAFRARFATLEDRLAQRRAAWAALARSFGTAAVFLDLSAPDLAVAERMLHAAIDRPVQRGAA